MDVNTAIRRSGVRMQQLQGESKLWWPLRFAAVNGGEGGEGGEVLHGREFAGRCLSGSANHS